MSEPASPQVTRPFSASGNGDASVSEKITTSRETIDAEIEEGLRAKFGVRPRPNDSLLALGVDSLGMAEFSLEIEKRFGVRVDEDILNVETVADLADYIYAKSLHRGIP